MLLSEALDGAVALIVNRPLGLLENVRGQVIHCTFLPIAADAGHDEGYRLTFLAVVGAERVIGAAALKPLS
ncbi:MAG: hypothetical protein WDN46_15930 [Methylocella sp.]